MDPRSLHERVAAPLDSPRRTRPPPAPKKRRQETAEDSQLLPPLNTGIIQPFVFNMQQMFPKFTNMMNAYAMGFSPHFVPQIIQPFMPDHELRQYREQQKQQKRTPPRPRSALHSSSSHRQISFRSPVADLRRQSRCPSFSSPLPRDFWAKVSTLSPRLLLDMRHPCIGPYASLGSRKLETRVPPCLQTLRSTLGAILSRRGDEQAEECVAGPSRQSWGRGGERDEGAFDWLRKGELRLHDARARSDFIIGSPTSGQCLPACFHIPSRSAGRFQRVSHRRDFTAVF